MKLKFSEGNENDGNRNHSDDGHTGAVNDDENEEASMNSNTVTPTSTTIKDSGNVDDGRTSTNNADNHYDGIDDTDADNHRGRGTQHTSRSTQHAARSTQHATRSTQHTALNLRGVMF